MPRTAVNQKSYDSSGALMTVKHLNALLSLPVTINDYPQFLTFSIKKKDEKRVEGFDCRQLMLEIIEKKYRQGCIHRDKQSYHCP